MNLIEKHNADIHEVRGMELETVISLLPGNSKNLKLLEIGAGTGFQLKCLKQHVKEAVGIDIPQSNYSSSRIEEIIYYDGVTLPFEDNSFDIVFSSNTLEHVVDLPAMHREIKRVLTPDGIAIHVLPTHVWKFWNTLIHYPMLPKVILGYFLRKAEKERDAKAYGDGTMNKRSHSLISLIKNVFFPPLHGERGNRFTEIFYLHTGWWSRHFRENGWRIIRKIPAGTYYSGHFALPINRRKVSRWLGSSCIIFLLQRQN